MHHPESHNITANNNNLNNPNTILLGDSQQMLDYDFNQPQILKIPD